MTDQKIDAPFVLGMINARGGSKGVPRKNIRMLGDKPLIAWSIDVAKQVPAISRCIISTEDQEIADVAREYGGDIPFMRPAELATDTSIQLDTIIYNTKKMEEMLGHHVDAVVLMQPTQPFRTPEDVVGCIDLLFKTNADSVITIAPNKHHPFGLWQDKENGQGLRMFLEEGQAQQKGFNRQAMPDLYMRTGAVYVIRRDVLVDQGSLYGDHVEGYVVDHARSWINIDDEHDFKMAEAWAAYQAS